MRRLTGSWLLACGLGVVASVGTAHAGEPDTDGSVWVARMGAGLNIATYSKWQDNFCLGGENETYFGCELGDFNGDGKTDAVRFTTGSPSNVMVALSNGTSFANATRWRASYDDHNNVQAGDFNGDGKDDLVSFDKGNNDVWVALSTGSAFAAPTRWHSSFSGFPQATEVGDFDGDGRDDIITFTLGNGGNVYVARSNGFSFDASEDLWHSNFASDWEYVAVGDFNGDGLDDILSFAYNSDNDVHVALSSASSFGTTSRWHTSFAAADSFLDVGDFDGDGKTDLMRRSYTGGAYFSRSTGSSFGVSTAANLMAGSPSSSRVGDLDGDGKDEVVIFNSNRVDDPPL